MPRLAIDDARAQVAKAIAERVARARVAADVAFYAIRARIATAGIRARRQFARRVARSRAAERALDTVTHAVRASDAPKVLARRRAELAERQSLIALTAEAIAALRLAFAEFAQRFEQNNKCLI